MLFGQGDKVCIGGVFGTGLWRRHAVHVVCQKLMPGARMQFFQTVLRFFPACSVSGTQTDPDETQFADGASMECANGIHPGFRRRMINVRCPARGQNQIHIKQPTAHGKSSSTREIIFASGFDVTFSVGCFQVFFPPECVFFIQTRLVVDQFKRLSVSR